MPCYSYCRVKGKFLTRFQSKLIKKTVSTQANFTICNNTTPSWLRRKTNCSRITYILKKITSKLKKMNQIEGNKVLEIIWIFNFALLIKNYSNSKVFEFILMIFNDVLFNLLQIIKLWLFFNDIFIEVVNVKLIFDFWLYWWFLFQSIYVCPIYWGKPRVLEYFFCVFISDSLFRILLKAFSY